jgi:hypothetical protein
MEAHADEMRQKRDEKDFMRFLAVTVMAMNTTVFWNVTSCTLVNKYSCFGGNCGLHIWGRRRWGQQVCPKSWYLSVKLQDVTFQWTVILGKCSLHDWRWFTYSEHDWYVCVCQNSCYVQATVTQKLPVLKISLYWITNLGWKRETQIYQFPYEGPSKTSNFISMQ